MWLSISLGEKLNLKVSGRHFSLFDFTALPVAHV